MAKRPTNRGYSEEFKRDAVALLRSSGRPIVEVARELGITDTSLGNWAREAAKTDSPVEAAGAEEAREAARLRKRVRELEEEIEILKRLTAYWVRSEGK